MRFVLRWTAAALLAGLGQAAAAAPFHPDLSQLPSVPLAMVRAPLAKAIEAAGHKGQPYRFAVQAPLGLSLADGLWDQLDAQTSRWRARISSPGAQSLNFEFSKFHLPEGAALWIYDADGALVQGPYTSANHTPEGKLWTALVLGEQAVLELHVPTVLRDEVNLELGEVNHGFRGFGKAGNPEDGSGSCNVDVVCPLGDDWRNEIRSVARISINGQYLCSGQLLNNVRQDADPLFVTANHCLIGQTNDTPASSVVFYWNYYNSACRSASGSSQRKGDGSLSENQSGSTLLAGDRDSDFTLLRLNQPPSSDFDVYLAGWDAGSTVPQSGVSVHHPMGWEKSISEFDSPAERGEIDLLGPLVQRKVQAWGVHWAQGTTEEGSSGGGLWDENHHIRGWLTGGDAGCGAPADSGSPDGEDFFGRMELAWAGKSSADAQLKAWLDPDDTGTTVLGGRNAHRVAASDDSASVPENSSETLIDVLANDSGDNLSITQAGTPDHGGSAVIRNSGSRIGYTPAPNFSGTERFSYTISDGSQSDTATVTVVVSGSGSSGGGGALSPGWLLLAAAAIWRRRAASLHN